MIGSRDRSSLRAETRLSGVFWRCKKELPDISGEYPLPVFLLEELSLGKKSELAPKNKTGLPLSGDEFCQKTQCWSDNKDKVKFIVGAC